MLHSVGDRLTSYILPARKRQRGRRNGGDGGPLEEEEFVGGCSSSSLRSRPGEETLEFVEDYIPSPKRLKRDRGFIDNLLTNSMAKMVEWLVHGKNYFFGAQLSSPDEDEQCGFVRENRAMIQKQIPIPVKPPSLRSDESPTRPVPRCQSALFSKKDLKRAPLHNAEKSHDIHRQKAGASNKFPQNSRTLLSPRCKRNLNAVKNRKFTVNECIRLEEKERYRQLIHQFAPEALQNSAATGDKLKNKQRTTMFRKHSPSGKSTESLLGTQLPTDFLQPSCSKLVPSLRVKMRLPQPSATIVDLSPKACKNRYGQSLAASPTLAKKDVEFNRPDTPEPYNSSRSSLQLKNKLGYGMSRNQKPVNLSFKTSSYLSDEWVKEIITSFPASKRELRRKIEEEEIKVKLYEGRRKAQEQKLEEQIQHRLKLAEQESAFLDDDDDDDDEDLKEAELPAITEDMEKEIGRALDPEPVDEVLVEDFKLTITRRNMITLAGLNWLNDEIINFYMNLLMARSHKPGYPKVYAFNTFFYPKLLNSGFSGVQRWTRKVDIFAMKYILVPIHLGMHWCLAVVNFGDKTICYYDSMGGENMQCLNTIKHYLAEEKRDKKMQEFDLNGWMTKTVKNIPHQMNGSDCGMFTCKYADYITRELPISFKQAHMPFFRRLMVYEILTKTLL